MRTVSSSQRVKMHIFIFILLFLSSYYDTIIVSFFILLQNNTRVFKWIDFILNKIIILSTVYDCIFAISSSYGSCVKAVKMSSIFFPPREIGVAKRCTTYVARCVPHALVIHQRGFAAYGTCDTGFMHVLHPPLSPLSRNSGLFIFFWQEIIPPADRQIYEGTHLALQPSVPSDWNNVEKIGRNYGRRASARIA